VELSFKDDLQVLVMNKADRWDVVLDMKRSR
jgi:hypothetical protein